MPELSARGHDGETGDEGVGRGETWKVVNSHSATRSHLNYLCGLAARAERRTKSSFIEAILDQKVHETPITPRSSENTIGSLAGKLWHVEDYQRLIALAENAPHLLNYDEQQIWAIIEDVDYFWYGRWERYTEEDFIESLDGVLEDVLQEERVRDLWPIILKIAAGEEDIEKLPKRHVEWDKASALGIELPKR